MSVPLPWLIACTIALLSLTLQLRAESRGPRWQVYLFKPLTTSVIVAAAVWQATQTPSRLAIAIVAGLLFSLAGDVFLMLPRDHFIAGLVSFLLAHVAYIIAFGLPHNGLYIVPYALAALVVLRLLWPHLGRLRLPVLVYISVIVLMAGCGAATRSLLATIGVTLFVASDATLALNKFRAPFASAQSIVMITYVFAQLCIGMSAA